MRAFGELIFRVCSDNENAEEKHKLVTPTIIMREKEFTIGQVTSKIVVQFVYIIS